MAEVESHGEEIDQLLKKLRPVLMEAIHGNFDTRIEMEEGDPLNEIYAGVQTLLDVICEQIKALDELGPQIAQGKRPTYSSFSKPSSNPGQLPMKSD